MYVAYRRLASLPNVTFVHYLPPSDQGVVMSQVTTVAPRPVAMNTDRPDACPLLPHVWRGNPSIVVPPT